MSDLANCQASKRRRSATKRRTPPVTIEYVELALSWDWSPEQISGVGNLMGMPVSNEWIYRYIAAGKHKVASYIKPCAEGTNDIVEKQKGSVA